MNDFVAHSQPASPPLVAVEGSYGEMGANLGSQTSDLVARSVDNYLRRFHDDAGLSERDIVRWGNIYLRIARDYNRDISDMLEGLAEGAEQRIEFVTSLNARTEMLYGTGYKEGGCTSLAVLPTETDSGHTLIAQNWDWHPEQGPVTFLLATRDEEGFEVLALAEAGMLAKSGLNSSGLGVCANLLVSGRDAGGEGVPYHYLLRGALQSKRMSIVHRRVLNVDRISSGNLLLADSGGEAIDIEVAPGLFGCIYPEGGVLTHSNHFASGIDVDDLKVATSANTLLRPIRARHLLAGASQRHGISKADIVTVLRDHYCFPDSICRHEDPETPTSEVLTSVYSILMDLDARELFIARQHPCEQPYARWRLADVFTPDAQPGIEFMPERRVPSYA